MNRYLKIFSIIIIAVSFYFLGHTLYSSWNQVDFSQIKLNFFFLPISLIFFFLQFFLNGFTFKKMLEFLDEKINIKDAVAVCALSQFAKYIPGKFWSMLSAVLLAKRVGIPVEKSTLSQVLGLFLFVLSGAFFSFGTFFIVPSKIFLYASIIMFIFCIIVLHPKILVNATNFVLKKMKREEINFNLSMKNILILFLLYLLIWLSHNLGAFFLVKSIFDLKFKMLHRFIGINSCAVLTGFLAFFVPGGLGIRESILSLGLKKLIQPAYAVIVSLVLRMWIVFCILIFGLIASIKFIKKNLK